MVYRQAVQDYYEEEWNFNCDDIAEFVFELMEQDWQPANRFTLTQMLGDEVPEYMLWIQQEIDDACPDETEIITFEPKQPTLKDTFKAMQAERAEEALEELEEELREEEREEIEIELLEARKELLELEIEELHSQQGIIPRIVGFFRSALGL